MTSLNLSEEYVYALPPDLSDIVGEYIPLRELVEISLLDLPDTIPSQRFWQNQFKLRDPQTYAELYDKFGTGVIKNFSVDTMTLMIMAGLYSSKFGPPLAKTDLVTDVYNLKLYLMLTYYKYPDLSPQSMYEQVKTHVRRGLWEGLIFLGGIGAPRNSAPRNSAPRNSADLDMSDLSTIPNIKTSDKEEVVQRRIIRRAVKKYEAYLLNLGGIPSTFYEKLLYKFPDLALRYVDQAKLKWSHWYHLGVDLVGGQFLARRDIPEFDYELLIQAYVNRIGPPKRSDVETALASANPSIPTSIRQLLLQYAV